MKQKGRFHKMKKYAIILFIFLMLIPNYLQPQTTFAHEAYSIQTLVDDRNMRFMTQVIFEKPGFTSREPDHHAELQLGSFHKKFKNATGGRVDIPDDPSHFKKYDGAKSEGNILEDRELLTMSFQPVEISVSYWSFGRKTLNHARGADADRAYFVADNLGTSLNGALDYVLGGYEPSSSNEFYDIVRRLMDGGRQVFNGNTFLIEYGKMATGKVPEELAAKGVRKSDYVKITRIVGGEAVESQEFLYRIRKGYDEDFTGNEVYYESLKKGFGATWEFFEPEVTNPKTHQDINAITWHMMVYYANTAYYSQDISASNADEFRKVGRLEEEIVSLLENLLNGIRSLLGLYSLNELVFNEGVRGSAAWAYGVFPKSWEENIMVFHWVFQAMAWSLISFAIVKMLIQKNFSTINPAMRMSIMDSVKDLLVTGFILASIFPLFNMFMYLNSSLVDVFAGLAPDMTSLSQLGNYSGILAGVILQFFYLFVSIYFNFIYILRSVTVAILIAMGPLFVVTIAFGPKWKQLFSIWSRELLSNIFLQSFHAFILAFFLTTTVSLRAIESLVIAFAMIPLTEFFRSLIMGQGGGVLSQLGTRSMVTAGAMVGAAASLGRSSNKKNGQPSNNEQRNEETGMSDSGAPRMSRNSEAMQMRQSAGNANTATRNRNNVPSHLDTAKAQANQQRSLDAFSRGARHEVGSFRKAGFKDAAGRVSGKRMIAGTGKIAGGAAQTLAGAGLGLALGGVSGDAMDMARRNIAGGLGTLGSTVSGAVSTVGAMGGDIREGFRAHNEFNAQSELNDAKGYEVLDEHLGARTLADGTNEVHRDAYSLSEAGIMNAHVESDGTQMIEYDANRLAAGDRRNLNQYAQITQNGTANQKEWLREQGIEGVYRTPNGNYAVKYNDVGKQRLGIQSMQKIGNDRFVERKDPTQSLATNKTITIGRTPPPMGPVNDFTSTVGNSMRIVQPNPNMTASGIYTTPNPTTPGNPNNIVVNSRAGETLGQQRAREAILSGQSSVSNPTTVGSGASGQQYATPNFGASGSQYAGSATFSTNTMNRQQSVNTMDFGTSSASGAGGQQYATPNFGASGSQYAGSATFTANTMTGQQSVSTMDFGTNSASRAGGQQYTAPTSSGTGSPSYTPTQSQPSTPAYGSGNSGYMPPQPQTSSFANPNNSTVQPTIDFGTSGRQVSGQNTVASPPIGNPNNIIVNSSGETLGQQRAREAQAFVPPQPQNIQPQPQAQHVQPQPNQHQNIGPKNMEPQRSGFNPNPNPPRTN